MEAPMEFWGVEVKVGQTVKVDPMDPVNAYIHISQVALGEAKKDKPSEPVVLYLKVGDQKIVLGTLFRDDIPHLSLDLVLDSESELSHTSKSASVFFCGYKVLTDDGNVSDLSDSEEDEELALEGQDNGKPEITAEGAKVTKPSKPVPMIGASAKQVKPVVPKKDEEDESDDNDDASDDEIAGEDESESSDEMDDDSDNDEESDSDEETPVKKVDQGKKRPNESASKAPVSAKKAKSATPEKIDGKKNVHIATPYPTKKGGKTPNSTKGQTPSSAGQLSCASCKKSFNNEVGLQQHKKAKHGGQ